jgi:hypothetical protein
MSLRVDAAKAIVGLRPSFSSHVRLGERGAPVFPFRPCTPDLSYSSCCCTKNRGLRGDEPCGDRECLPLIKK